MLGPKGIILKQKNKEEGSFWCATIKREDGYWEFDGTRCFVVAIEKPLFYLGSFWVKIPEVYRGSPGLEELYFALCLYQDMIVCFRENDLEPYPNPGRSHAL